MRALGVFVVLAVSTTAVAQQRWLQLNLVKVKPEYVSEFVELQKNHISPLNKERGVPWRNAWRTATFGNTYEFGFSTPIQTFADLDQEREPNPEISAKFTKYVSDRESHAFIFREDLSVPPADGTTFRLAVVNELTIAPGREADYEAHLKEHVLPYMSDPEAGIQGFHVYEKPFGGPVVWWTVIFLDSYAYIDGGSPGTRVHGSEKMDQIGAEVQGIVQSVDRTLWRYLPELSYDTSEETTSEP